MTDEKPGILKRALQLLQKIPAKQIILYTESIEEYLEKDRHSNMVLTSNFRSVNGMEFDHVIVFTSDLEYYLKFYLPQVISRCTYNLKFVLLPTERRITNIQTWLKQKILSEIWYRNLNKSV